MRYVALVSQAYCEVSDFVAIAVFQQEFPLNKFMKDKNDLKYV